MRSLFLIFFVALLLPCFSQNNVALVTTKKGEVAYFNLQKGITYVEKKPDPAPVESICKFNNGFARARRLSLFYYIDETGKPVFNSSFEKAEDFYEHFAQVKIEGKWGFINQKGEIIIKPQFYETHPFSSGISQVAMKPKGKHGYIDTMGNFVLEPQFDNAKPFEGNRAWVYLNGKWSMIDKNGKTLIPALYNEVKDLSEGYTWVKKDALWGLIDSAGNYLIKPDERNPLMYATNATFKVFSEFHNGLIRYQSRNLYGYLDKRLNVVIPAKYDKVSDFKNGLACVYQDGYCGLIDVTGKTVIPINYKEIIIGNNDLFPAKDDNGDWGYLNLKNEWVMKPEFKHASPFVSTHYN